MASVVLDQFLRCAVCMDFFKDPHRLPCGHSFCRQCIEGVRQHCLSFNCPECREMVHLDGKGVDGLEKERRLGAMVTEFAQQQQQSRVCKEHIRTVDGYCETCSLLVCGKCFFSQQHQGHAMEEIEGVAARKKEELQNLLQIEKDTIERGLKRKEEINNIQKQIRDTFQEMRDHLMQKEASLHLELDRMTQALVGIEEKQGEDAMLNVGDIPEDPIIIIQTYVELKERVEKTVKKIQQSMLSAIVPRFSYPSIEPFLKDVRLEDDFTIEKSKTSECTEEKGGGSTCNTGVIQVKRSDKGDKDKKAKKTTASIWGWYFMVTQATSLNFRLLIAPDSVIHSASMISSGKIVLLDLTSTIHVYDSEGNHIHKVKLNDKAYDITVLSESTLAVSTGAAKRIVLLDITETGISETSTIDIDTECFHVSCFEDKIVTANGSVASFFDIMGKRQATIIMSGMIQYLYISKMHRKMFINIRSQYVMRTDLKGYKEFKYRSEDLGEVCGITVDNKCHAFICGCASDNVHYIDSTGVLIRIILSRKDNISSPVIVGIDSHLSLFFLIQKNENCVKLYDVTT